MQPGASRSPLSLTRVTKVPPQKVPPCPHLRQSSSARSRRRVAGSISKPSPSPSASRFHGNLPRMAKRSKKEQKGACGATTGIREHEGGCGGSSGEPWLCPVPVLSPRCLCWCYTGSPPSFLHHILEPGNQEVSPLWARLLLSGSLRGLRSVPWGYGDTAGTEPPSRSAEMTGVEGSGHPLTMWGSGARLFLGG